MSISKALASMAAFIVKNPASTASERALAKAVIEDNGDELPEFLGGPAAPWSPNSGTPNFVNGGPPKGPPRSSARDPIVTAPTSRGLQGRELEELNRGMGVRPIRPQFERLETGELLMRHATRAEREERNGRSGGIVFGSPTELRSIQIQRRGDR